MGKSKKRRKKSKSFEIRPEVTGIFLILFSVLAYGPGKPLGIVGQFARGLAVFLFGSFDWLFIVFTLIVGIYMLFKGSRPSFWSTKFIGLFFVTIGILVFAHMNYIINIKGDFMKIYEATFKDLSSTFDLIRKGSEFVSPGGGLVGCTFAIIFNTLFAISGKKEKI